MSKKMVIIGGGGHAKVVISILKKSTDYEIIGYTDDKDKGLLNGIPYIGTDDHLKKIIETDKNCSAAIAVGMVDILGKRQALYIKLNEMGLKFPVIVSRTAIVNDDVTIEQGSMLMDGVVVNTASGIGKFVVINTNATIEHDCIIGDYCHIAPGSVISGGVEIGDNCFIGAGACIKHGIKICSQTLVGIGSVVIKDINLPGVYGGNPVRKIK